MSYQYQNVDTTEPVSDTDGEIKANVHLYGVISGCDVTLDATDLTVDVAAGVIVHNGSVVSVAAQANAVTLVADASNPRFSWVALNSSGTAVLVSGDASSDPVVPELGDYVALSLIRIPANESLASNCTDIEKRIPAHVPIALAEGPVELRHPGGTTATTKQLNSNTTMSVGRVRNDSYIVATALQFNVTAVGTAGTLDIALFSNDGQTKLFEVTSGSISGSAVVSVAVSDKVLPPGDYYVAVVPNGTADITVSTWNSSAPFAAAAQTGLNEISGTVTVTAGTIPSSFDPDADVSYVIATTLAVRIN